MAFEYHGFRNDHARNASDSGRSPSLSGNYRGPTAEATRTVIVSFPLQRTTTISADLYLDPEVWQRERAAIWATEWIHVGYRHQFEAVGGYVTSDVAGWQVFVHRGTDGELRAFHNVCPHRAGPIVHEGQGCQAALVCRYHGWSFHADGLLRSARDFGADVPADTRLTMVRVHDWRGLIFVCLSDTAAEFDVWIGDFAGACADIPLEQYRYHSSTSRVMRCNWKTYADNYLENYHVAFVHPAMAQRDLVAKDARCHVGDDPRWSIQSATTRDGGLASGMYTWRWPNFAFDVFPGGVAFERFVPVTIDRTELVFDYFFDVDATDVDDIIAASEVIVDEDVMIVEATQRNLASGVYHSGLLSPRHENGLAAFHALIDSAVGGPP